MKNFKLLSIFLTLALCAGFSSCSKDDDEPEKDLTSVVGTWEANETTELGATKVTSVYKSDLTYTDKAEISGAEIASESGTYVYDPATKILTRTGISSFMGIPSDEAETSTFTVSKLTTKQMTLVDSDDAAITYSKK